MKRGAAKKGKRGDKYENDRKNFKKYRKFFVVHDRYQGILFSTLHKRRT